MGSVETITSTKWPKQGDFLGRRVEVIFNYDTSHIVPGTIVRDDVEAPWQTIIQLENGRFVLGTECQYSSLSK